MCWLVAIACSMWWLYHVWTKVDRRLWWMDGYIILSTRCVCWSLSNACVHLNEFVLKWCRLRPSGYFSCINLAGNGSRVFWSELTDLVLKYNRMLLAGNGYIFQWYFTGLRSFSGIFRNSCSFGATQPIFPCSYHPVVKSC
jgi:hypothetical protein